MEKLPWGAKAVSEAGNGWYYLTFRMERYIVYVDGEGQIRAFTKISIPLTTIMYDEWNRPIPDLGTDNSK